MSDNKQGVSDVSSTTEMSSGHRADAISPHRHHHHHHHVRTFPPAGPEPTPKVLCLKACTCTNTDCSCDNDCHCKKGSMSLESAAEDNMTGTGNWKIELGCKVKNQK
ncbi:hypothetical protein OBBRIDRAFT_791778 [Obba rivulosa]|uniref:Uncharacterized protein n=1 Tax=Obba rivulosa TaxID=1052685 RepID=A0A8E2DMA6_9APHY|nr:hypothetical protein OBBRIDRAFT_791778 [Obba rivulosa]